MNWATTTFAIIDASQERESDNPSPRSDDQHDAKRHLLHVSLTDVHDHFVAVDDHQEHERDRKENHALTITVEHHSHVFVRHRVVSHVKKGGSVHPRRRQDIANQNKLRNQSGK